MLHIHCMFQSGTSRLVRSSCACSPLSLQTADALSTKPSDLLMRKLKESTRPPLLWNFGSCCHWFELKTRFAKLASAKAHHVNSLMYLSSSYAFFASLSFDAQCLTFVLMPWLPPPFPLLFSLALASFHVPVFRQVFIMPSIQSIIHSTLSFLGRMQPCFCRQQFSDSKHDLVLVVRASMSWWAHALIIEMCKTNMFG